VSGPSKSYAFWECPECAWVGLSEDGHCRQFDEHPDGPRIPLRTVTLVCKRDLVAEIVTALRNDRTRGWSEHPADFIAREFGGDA
jgi:hypothetical protein